MMHNSLYPLLINKKDKSNELKLNKIKLDSVDDLSPTNFNMYKKVLSVEINSNAFIKKREFISFY